MPSPEWAQCQGDDRRKIRYPTRREAKRAARQVTQKYGDGRLVAYRCPWCSDYHVGHLSLTARL